MYFILFTFLLLAAYIGLLAIEARRATRYLAPLRARLDGLVEQGALILTHVDFAHFARQESLALARRATHTLARTALMSIRSAEGALTRLVRHLHLHPDVARPAGESARVFVRTLSEFKGQLEATRPQMPEIR